MPTRTDTRAQFLANIITAAIEGGTGYWAVVHSYKWTDLPPSEVHAIIMEEDEEHTARLNVAARSFRNLQGRKPRASDLLDIKLNEADDTPLLYKLDIEVIARGIARIKDGTVGVRADLKRAIVEADRENEAGDIDADGADVIVQAALFGELVYG